MRIASITMIGQFPDGIDLHIRNLRWALTEEDHIFIVTPQSIIDDLSLIDDDRTTYVPFLPKETAHTGFINFWREFPDILTQYDIHPEWFLLMEADIWFFARPSIHDDPHIIRSFLPQGSYRNILAGGKVIHPRVWEGAQLIHRDVIQNAIKFGIDFSFVSRTFFDKNKTKYEDQHGPITMSMYKHPDTMDEFGLYCALEAKTSIDYCVKALHLRGPECLHRQFPDLYQGGSKERVSEIQKRMPYFDVLLAIAVYYTAGLWENIDHLDWTQAWPESKREIDRLLITGMEWMEFHEYTRLDSLRLLMQGFNGKTQRR